MSSLMAKLGYHIKDYRKISHLIGDVICTCIRCRGTNDSLTSRDRVEHEKLNVNVQFVPYL